MGKISRFIMIMVGLYFIYSGLEGLITGEYTLTMRAFPEKTFQRPASIFYSFIPLALGLIFILGVAADLFSKEEKSEADLEADLEEALEADLEEDLVEQSEEDIPNGSEEDEEWKP